MKWCWVPISPDAQGKYIAEPGGFYAALLAVDTRGTVSDVTGDLTKQGFQVIYTWESGQPTRGKFFVDNWLANLPKSAEGTRWIYLELKYAGSEMKSIARHFEKCTLGICGAADVSYVFAATQVPDIFHPCGPGDPNQGSCSPLPPPCPGCPPKPSPWKPAMLGAAAGGAATLFLAWWLR
jgi:hypothetical protein